jgi:hypothetical protein
MVHEPSPVTQPVAHAPHGSVIRLAPVVAPAQRTTVASTQSNTVTSAFEAIARAAEPAMPAAASRAKAAHARSEPSSEKRKRWLVATAADARIEQPPVEPAPEPEAERPALVPATEELSEVVLKSPFNDDVAPLPNRKASLPTALPGNPYAEP